MMKGSKHNPDHPDQVWQQRSACSSNKLQCWCCRSICSARWFSKESMAVKCFEFEMSGSKKPKACQRDSNYLHNFFNKILGICKRSQLKSTTKTWFVSKEAFYSIFISLEAPGENDFWEQLRWESPKVALRGGWSRFDAGPPFTGQPLKGLSLGHRAKDGTCGASRSSFRHLDHLVLAVAPSKPWNCRAKKAQSPGRATAEPGGRSPGSRTASGPCPRKCAGFFLSLSRQAFMKSLKQKNMDMHLYSFLPHPPDGVFTHSLLFGYLLASDSTEVELKWW